MTSRDTIPVSFDLTEEEWRAVDTALGDVMDLIHDAANVFEFLWDHVASGAGDRGLDSLTGTISLAARALRGTDKEARALDQISRKLRQAVAAHRQDQRQTELQGAE